LYDEFVGDPVRQLRETFDAFREDPGVLTAYDLWNAAHQAAATLAIFVPGALEGEGGVVYRRTNPKTREQYIGQAMSDQHFLKRQWAEDSKLRVKHEYELVERAKPGQTLDVAEEGWIRRGGGPTNKSNPGGGLANKRHQMNETRYRKAGGTVDKDY